MPVIDTRYLQNERPIAGVINRPQVRENRSLGYKEVRLHVSDIMKVDKDHKFCVREHVIRKLYQPVVPAQALSASMQLLFDLGNALHDSARNRWMQYDPHGAKRVLARWHCVCGKTEHTGVNPFAIICKHCGNPPSVFGEFEIFDPNLKIVAHPDFTIVKGKNVIETGAFDKERHVIRIVEIKGIDRVDLDWYRLDGPLGEHTLQGDFYYWLMRDNGFRVDPIISYLYGDRAVKKTLFTGEPWKEFEVQHGPRERVEKFFDKARAVLSHIEHRRVPARTCCSSLDAARAKNCSLSSICFGLPTDAFDKAPEKKRRVKPLRKHKALSI